MSSLLPQGEAEWARVQGHLEMMAEFALIFVFSGNSGVLAVFQERIAAFYRAHVTRLSEFKLQDPEEVWSRVMPELLQYQGEPAEAGQPRWLDLSQPGEDWRHARLNFLVRLNERRERLREVQGRPLILVLPLSEHPEIPALVPDLWAIRDLTLILGDWLPARSIPVAPLDPVPLREWTKADARILARWERVKGSEDLGVFRSGIRASQRLREAGRLEEAAELLPRLLAMGQLLGERLEVEVRAEAAEVLRQLGRLEEAQGHAELEVVLRRRLEPMSRQLEVALSRLGNVVFARNDFSLAQAAFDDALAISRRQATSEAPYALRNLSSSLKNIGDTCLALGQFGQAQEHYLESLQLRQQLASSGTPEALRDLSLSHISVGDIGLVLGKTDVAAEHYEASVDIFQQLSSSGSPQDLRNLSIALGRAGDLARRLGKLDEAGRHYSQSLQISQQVAGSGTSEDLLNLSAALSNVGDINYDMGKVAEAQQLYIQSLEIAREVAGSGSVAAIRDISVSLNKLGDTCRQQGRSDEARIHYNGSLEIARQLAASRTQEALYDLSVSLCNMGDLDLSHGDFAKARQEYAESLLIARELATSGTPKALSDLASSLMRMGGIEGTIGNFAEARQHLAESLQIAVQLSKSGVPQDLHNLVVSHTRAGHQFIADNDSEKAQFHFREALMVAQKLLSKQGDTPETFYDVAASYLNLSLVDPTNAAAHRAKGRYYADWLVRRFPEVPAYADMLQRLQEPPAQPPTNDDAPPKPPGPLARAAGVVLK